MKPPRLKTIEWDGFQITEPGIYHKMPLSVYHSPFICAGDMRIPQGLEPSPGITTFHPSISSSGLRQIYGRDKSPKHFYAQWRGNPGYLPDPLQEEKKRHFVLGRATHHLFLGERDFAKHFKIRPDEYPDRKTGELKRWNGNAEYCQKWMRDCLAEGRSWLTAKEVEAIKHMADSIAHHPLVQAGVLNGLIERSIFWRDEETGVWLKARPDAIPTDSGDAADLKLTYRSYTSVIRDAINNYGYYRQTALIRDAFASVLKLRLESFTYIFVEHQDPWHTRDVRCYEKDLAIGAKENRAAIRIFAKCIETGEWPGPGDNNIGNERLGMSDEQRTAAKDRLKYEAGITTDDD